MTTQPAHFEGPHSHTHDYLQRLGASFEAFSSKSFAEAHAKNVVLDQHRVKTIASNISDDETVTAASFLARIGGDVDETLSPDATDEEKVKFEEERAVRAAVRRDVLHYEKLFGIRFVMCVGTKSPAEVLEVLKTRMANPRHVELSNAREAMADIAFERLRHTAAYNQSDSMLQQLATKHSIAAFQVSLTTPAGEQSMAYGANITDGTFFGLGSMAHPVATAFAFEFFAQRKISLDSSVNQLLARANTTKFRIGALPGVPVDWANAVSVRHLLRHTSGIATVPLNLAEPAPGSPRVPQHFTPLEFLLGNDRRAVVEQMPGKTWRFCFAGFAVLQHVIEALEQRSIADIAAPFLKATGMEKLGFTLGQQIVHGRDFASPRDDFGNRIPGGRMLQPAFVAGAFGTAAALHRFASCVYSAFKSLDGHGPLSHDSARRMLHHPGYRRGGCHEALGLGMGSGYYIFPTEENDWMIYNGAMAGYRSLQLFCIDGPDEGKGFTINAAGEADATVFIAAVARKLCAQLDLHSFAEVKPDESGASTTDFEGKIYRETLFNCFAPDRPEAIPRQRGDAKDARFMDNLLSGATVDFCSNDRFGRVENLISRFEPQFDPLWFGRQGKVIDCWETSRHNNKDCDSAVFRLKTPGDVKYIYISTKFIDETFVTPFIQIQGCNDPNERAPWFDVLPVTRLEAHSILRIAIEVAKPVRRVRINNIPDGGIARVFLYSQMTDEYRPLYKLVGAAHPLKIAHKIPQTRNPTTTPYHVSPATAKRYAAAVGESRPNAASAAFGAEVQATSKGAWALARARDVISPFLPLHMYDGVLTRRSRQAGNSEAISIKLAWCIRLEYVVMDFTHFRNNAPVEAEIRVRAKTGRGEWVVAVPRRYVKHYGGGVAKLFAVGTLECEEVQVALFPCGGFNRIEAYGPRCAKL